MSGSLSSPPPCIVSLNPSGLRHPGEVCVKALYTVRPYAWFLSANSHVQLYMDYTFILAQSTIYPREVIRPRRPSDGAVIGSMRRYVHIATHRLQTAPYNIDICLCTPASMCTSLRTAYRLRLITSTSVCARRPLCARARVTPHNLISSA